MQNQPIFETSDWNMETLEKYAKHRISFDALSNNAFFSFPGLKSPTPQFCNGWCACPDGWILPCSSHSQHPIQKMDGYV